MIWKTSTNVNKQNINNLKGSHIVSAFELRHLTQLPGHGACLEALGRTVPFRSSGSKCGRPKNDKQRQATTSNDQSHHNDRYMDSALG